jgi:hypothetical protein
MAQPTGSATRRALLTYCLLWPGFPQLWVDGNWFGLAQAVGFAILLQGALLATVVWTGLLGSLGWWTLWGAVVASWLTGVYASLGWYASRPTAAGVEPRARDLFPRALNEYLLGNWFKAEADCRELLSSQNHDVDAGLLLVSVLRRSGRVEEARGQLNQLRQWDAAAKWEWEIRNEQQQLDNQADQAIPSKLPGESPASILEAA